MNLYTEPRSELVESDYRYGPQITKIEGPDFKECGGDYRFDDNVRSGVTRDNACTLIKQTTKGKKHGSLPTQETVPQVLLNGSLDPSKSALSTAHEAGKPPSLPFESFDIFGGSTFRQPAASGTAH